MRELTDKARLALLGLAVGDAFGAPFEYHPQARKLSRLSMAEGRYLDSWDDVGQRKVKWCRKPGLYTDDTQQALILLHAWMHREDPEDAAAYFVGICQDMANIELSKHTQFGVHRGTGGNFRTAIRTGQPADTAGLGAPMRVGPVATLFDDPQEMLDWILAVSRTTTSNPISLASTAKFAAVSWVLANPERRTEIRDVVWDETIPSEVWAATSAALRVMKGEGEKALVEYGTATGWANKPMSCAANGFALTGFPWAVNQALTSNTFGDALVRVCASGGDTDTVGAMAGCLAALKFGSAEIPDWMSDTLVGRRGVLNPEKWHPIIDEVELTELDIDYQKVCATKAARSRKQKTESRQVLDMFAMAEEAMLEEEAIESDAVLFFGAKKYDGEFSNFHTAEFDLDGETWPSVEHYFMAQKNLEDEGYHKAIRKAKTPAAAKKLGRKVELRDGWDDIKYDIMFNAVRAKFEQNPGLRSKLLATGDRDIHENCRDPWWGGGPNFPEGRDWLGQILADVRDLLRGGG
jgi:ribA/ribD-fused uncharacterized protein